MTAGIWMWSEPFNRRVANEDIAILLMDTQGLNDNGTDMPLTTAIFAFSTLVSSYQVLCLIIALSSSAVSFFVTLSPLSVVL
jgi:hypothetical protein